MKKITLLILSTFLSVVAFSQIVTLEGFLLDQNGVGVGNQVITMNYNSNPSNVNGTVTALTDTNGYYTAGINISPDTAVQFSYLWNDCNGVLQIDSGFAVVGLTGGVYSYNLNYCPNTVSCQAFAWNTVNGNSVSLASSSQGVAPYTYLWNNGATTPSQTLNLSNGTYTYCVTITDANGCTSNSCTSFTVNVTPTNCQAAVYDSMLTNGVYQLMAQSNGVAPFSYSWSNGASTASTIYQLPAGTHSICCIVTDATGCSDTACTTIVVASAPTCSSSISVAPINSNTFQFTSVASGVGPFSYSWYPAAGASNPTGQTTTYTFNTPGAHGVACIVTDANGCVSMDSTFVTIAPPPTSTTISGMVFTDTTVFNECIVFLIEVDTNSAASTILTAVDTTFVTQGFYNFTNVPNGAYYIKAALLPNHIQYASYLASYHSNVPNATSWSSANLHTISSPVTSTGNDIYLTQGVNSGGPGFIGGLVSQGAGKGGDYTPKANVEVFVFNSTNQVAGFAYSDANGVFELPNLAYGDYTISVDVPGIPTNTLQVTVDAASPSLNNIYVNIEQNEVQITQGLPLSVDGVHAQTVRVYPNPASSQLTIEQTSMNDFTTYTLHTISGKVVQKGFISNQLESVSIEALPTGIYILKISGTQLNQQFLINKL